MSFKDHLSTVLRKVYANVGALRRLRKLVPADISLTLYKAYILPHLEYCSPLLLGINKTLNEKLESANHYALKALLNFGNSLDYDSILSAVNMQSLKHRRYYQSLALLFKCIKEMGLTIFLIYSNLVYCATSQGTAITISFNHPIIIDIITILSLTRLHICGVSFLLTSRDRLN